MWGGHYNENFNLWEERDEMSSSSRKYPLSFLQMYFSTLDSISSPPRPKRQASKGKEEPPEEQLHLLFNLFLCI